MLVDAQKTGAFHRNVTNRASVAHNIYKEQHDKIKHIFWSTFVHSFNLKWNLIYASESLEMTDVNHFKINLNIKSVHVAQTQIQCWWCYRSANKQSSPFNHHPITARAHFWVWLEVWRRRWGVMEGASVRLNQSSCSWMSESLWSTATTAETPAASESPGCTEAVSSNHSSNKNSPRETKSFLIDQNLSERTTRLLWGQREPSSGLCVETPEVTVTPFSLMVGRNMTSSFFSPPFLFHHCWKSVNEN